MKCCGSDAYKMKINMLKRPLTEDDCNMELFPNKTAFKLQNEFLFY